MDHVVAARAQMGTSLAFHIVFAALGVGLPLWFVCHVMHEICEAHVAKH